ncbi:hypothetical protein L7F22_060349 [Adiantum nelumboides]|nr:hypothetical protein [Adiantum nelumboides]
MVERVAHWRQLLATSLQANGHLKHSSYFQLATVRRDGRPANRTIVFRNFVEESNLLQFTTDSRSDKIEEIFHNPRGEAKWEQYFPLVEYAYNNTVHSSTGKAPFEIVEGGKKVPPILHTKDKIFEADKYVQDMDEMYKKVKVTLEKTQAKHKKAVDRHRREVVFSLGDWVLLRFEKARLKKMKGKERLFPKLSMRYYVPCDKISDVAYRLKLLKNWKIDNAFHACESS